MVSSASLTSAIDLARSWNSVFLEIVSMTSNSQIHIQASPTLSGTYRRVYQAPLNSSTVACNTFAIVSSVSNGFVPIPAALRYVKIETTATIDNSATVFRLHCGDA
jgi:hypothetical protein